MCGTFQSFVCYQTCECNIVQTRELISIQIGTSGQRDKGTKRSGLGSKGQRYRSCEVEDRFGGLAKLSFWIPSGQIAFLMFNGF